MTSKTEMVDEPSKPTISRRHVLGVICALIVVLLWTLSNFLLEHVLKNNSGSPAFMSTWLSLATFQLYLVVWFIRKQWRLRKVCPECIEMGPDSKQELKSAPVEEEKLPPFTIRETAKMSAYFCAVFVLSNYLANASFGLTEVSSASLLLSTSGVFTLLFARLLHLENMSWLKSAAVLLSLGGVLTLGIQEFSKDKNTVQGTLYALISAALYGMYSVALRKMVGNTDRLDNSLFFGFVGLFSTVFLWPLFFILDKTGVEPFQWPPLPILQFMLFNAFFCSFLSQYLWLLANLLTSPLVVALTLSLCCPAALIVDWLWNELDINSVKIIATLLMVAGFMAINFAEVRPDWDSSLAKYMKSLFRKHK